MMSKFELSSGGLKKKILASSFHVIVSPCTGRLKKIVVTFVVLCRCPSCALVGERKKNGFASSFHIDVRVMFRELDEKRKSSLRRSVSMFRLCSGNFDEDKRSLRPFMSMSRLCCGNFKNIW